MKTLSISLYNRPKYTEQMLNHLDSCYNIEDYKIIICCEPKNEQVINLAKSFRPHQTSVNVNPVMYGCNWNIFQCLHLGFQNSDYHIHLEDDTIPGKDFLLYCEWARQQYINDDNIFAVSGYVNVNNKTEHYSEYSQNITMIKRRNWFTPWGWATWKNRWDSIKVELYSRLTNEPRYSWDHHMHNIVKNFYEIFPSVSRIQNIGAEYGTYVPSADWHKNHQYNEFWIESIQQYSNQFIESNNS